MTNETANQASVMRGDQCDEIMITVTAEGYYVCGVRADGEQETCEFGTMGGVVDFMMRHLAKPQE
jgi:hypothetical protein